MSKIIKTQCNPFGNYFKDLNPDYQNVIDAHYFQTIELVMSNNKSIVLTEFRKNKDKQSDNVLYYFCGYNDYFYHFHIFSYEKDYDVIVIDIPGFGYNKKYCDRYPYQPKKRFNFYDNISEVNDYLDFTFAYLESNCTYKKKYIYGYSCGANIMINYLFYLQRNNKKKPCDRVLLCSPLARFYTEPVILSYIFIFISFVIALITRHFDMNLFYKGSNTPNDKTEYNRALNNIYNTKSLEYVNHKYTGKLCQPILNGFVNCVELNTVLMKDSNMKVDCDLRVVCAYNYGDSNYWTRDSCLNPSYIIDDVNKIFTKPIIKQFHTGHDCLLTPNDDGFNISYKDVLEFFFE